MVQFSPKENNHVYSTYQNEIFFSYGSKVSRSMPSVFVKNRLNLDALEYKMHENVECFLPVSDLY